MLSKAWLRFLRMQLSQAKANDRTNLGKWNLVYAGLTAPYKYGDDTTYRLAADFLRDAALVEGWGCGGGRFRQFCQTMYVGIDGSSTPFADKIDDLCRYTSDVDAILLRHVLEHNTAWQTILQNAITSFRKKLCIVPFTPLVSSTHVIGYDTEMDVVDISFCKDDIIACLQDLDWRLQGDILTASQYGSEHIFCIESRSHRT